MSTTLYLSDAIAQTKQVDLLTLIGATTTLRKVAAREYAGPCAKCGGTDLLRVNLDKGWFCRQCQSEEHWHDAIDWRMWLYGERLFVAIENLIGRRVTDPEQIKRIQQDREAMVSTRRAEEAAKQQTARQKLQASHVWRVYNANLDKLNKRSLWQVRGLTDGWQDYYQVGYCPSREWYSGEQKFISDSLTIPYFQYTGPGAYECIGLRHRLLCDNPAGGKYRPEYSGLGNHLFTPWYEQPINGDVLLVEGEIKAAVTFSAFWVTKELENISPMQTVVGVSGKSIKPELLDGLRDAERITICLDPDAQREAHELAKTLGAERCKVIGLPDKIDDLIVMGVIDGFDLLKLLEG